MLIPRRINRVDSRGDTIDLILRGRGRPSPSPSLPVFHDHSQRHRLQQQSTSSNTRLNLLRSSRSLLEGTTTTTVPAVTSQLSIAFLLGGLFFSVILPRLISWLSYIPQKARQKASQIKRSKQKQKHQYDRIKFQTVKKQGLAVLQHVTDNLIKRSFQTQLQRGFTEALDKVDNPNIRYIKLQSFETCSSPLFTKGRIYQDIDNAMIFDADLTWTNVAYSELEITTKRLGLKVPVILQGVRLDGTVRIILTPLENNPPGFGAILVSFPNTPSLEVDVDIAGRPVTKVPWLKQALIVAIKGIVENQMVWPNRIVNVALEPNFNKTILDQPQIEQLKTTDPFLNAENATALKRSRLISNASNTTEDKDNDNYPKTWKKRIAPNKWMKANKLLQPVVNWATRSQRKNATVNTQEASQSTTTKAKSKSRSDRRQQQKPWDWDKIVGGIFRQFNPKNKQEQEEQKPDDYWEKLMEGVLKSFDDDDDDDKDQSENKADSRTKNIQIPEPIGDNNNNNTSTKTMPPSSSSSSPIDELEILQEKIQTKANKTMEILSSVNSIDEFMSILDP